MTDSIDVGLVIFYFVAGVVMLALGVVLLRPLWMPLWHLFHRTQQFLDDWNGEPARHDDAGRKVAEARPGAMARLAQLETNHGGTMRDQVDRIERQLAGVRDDVEEVRTSAEDANTAARQAVTAAGLAVNEAKVGRAVMAEAAEKTREQINEIRGAVGGLASSMSEIEQRASASEVAYVRALKRLGVNLTDVTDELDDGER